MRLTLRWVPGHEGVDGNKLADEEAKDAAAGHTSRRDDLPQALRRRVLPLSVAKARQNHLTHLKEKAAKRWRTSARGLRLREIDESLPSIKYMKLTAPLPRRHASLLFQLRTNTAPLYKHLERIGKTPSSDCPTCRGEPETVPHFLLRCPSYNLHRAIHLAPLGFKRTLPRLLNSAKGLAPLFAFINATGRFRHIHGDLRPTFDDDDEGDGAVRGT